MGQRLSKLTDTESRTKINLIYETTAVVLLVWKWKCSQNAIGFRKVIAQLSLVEANGGSRTTSGLVEGESLSDVYLKNYVDGPAMVHVTLDDKQYDTFAEVDLGRKQLKKDNSAPSIVLSPSKWLGKLSNKDDVESSESLLSDEEDHSPRQRSKSNERASLPTSSTSSDIIQIDRFSKVFSLSKLTQGSRVPAPPPPPAERTIIRKLSGTDDKKLSLSGLLPDSTQVYPKSTKDSGFIYIASPREGTNIPVPPPKPPTKRGETGKKGWTEKEFVRRIRNLEEEIRMGEGFKRALRETMQSQIDFLKMEQDLDREKMTRLERELTTRRKETENRDRLSREWNVSEEDLLASFKPDTPPLAIRELSLSGNVMDDKRGVLLFEKSYITPNVIAKQSAMTKKLKRQLAMERQKLDGIERSRQDRLSFMKKLEDTITASIDRHKEEKIFLDQLKEERIFLDQLSYLPSTKQAKSISSETIRTPEEEQVSRQLEEVNRQVDSLTKSTARLAEQVSTDQKQLETMQEQGNAFEKEAEQKSTVIQSNIVILEEALKSIEMLLEEAKALNESINNLNVQIVDLRTQIDRHKMEREENREQISKMEAQIRLQSKQMEDSLRNFEQLTATRDHKIKSLDAEISNLTERLSDERERLKNTEQTLERERLQAQKALEELNGYLENARAEHEHSKKIWAGEKGIMEGKMAELREDQAALVQLRAQHEVLKTIHEEDLQKLQKAKETEMLNIQLQADIEDREKVIADIKAEREEKVAQHESEKSAFQEQIDHLRNQSEEARNVATQNRIDFEMNVLSMQGQLDAAERKAEEEKRNCDLIRNELEVAKHVNEQARNQQYIMDSAAREGLSRQLERQLDEYKALSEQMASIQAEKWAEKEKHTQELSTLRLSLESANAEVEAKTQQNESLAQKLKEMEDKSIKWTQEHQQLQDMMATSEEKDKALAVLQKQLDQTNASLEEETQRARTTKEELLSTNVKLRDIEASNLQMQEAISRSPPPSAIAQFKHEVIQLRQQLIEKENESNRLREEHAQAVRRMELFQERSDSGSATTMTNNLREEVKKLRIDLRTAFDELSKEKRQKAEVESRLQTRMAELELLQASLKGLQERSTLYAKNLVSAVDQRHAAQVTSLEEKLRNVTGEMLQPPSEDSMTAREAELYQKLEKEGQLVRQLHLAVRELTDERDRLLGLQTETEHESSLEPSSPVKINRIPSTEIVESAMEKELYDLREWKSRTEDFIFEMERAKLHGITNSEYLKNVVLKFLVTDDAEKEKLLPVIASILQMNTEDVNKIKSAVAKRQQQVSSVPSGLFKLSQFAVNLAQNKSTRKLEPPKK
ncbi:putative kinesin [Planoprotostelium fungivorum]|uniref:Putative kinesin n=1 Tax=Planoprotostelium fungivorum TaxID=1890364 RepID=A0A2P6NCM2_9EUKA|nr:putative kinesin [Planoprotostelium fungivorum]